MRFPLTITALVVFASLATSKADLIGLFTFDNAADPFEDSSVSANHITSSAGPGGPVWGAATGYEGTGGYEFSGDGDRLIVPIDINPASIPQMTWGAWVRTNNTGGGLRKVMGHDNGGWDRTIGMDDREGPVRYTSFVGNRRPVLGPPGPVNTTDWTFFAATYDQNANSVKVYLDLDATSSGDPLDATTEPTAFQSGFPTFSIGSLRPDNDAEGWDGAIDNAFIFDEVLDEARLSIIRRRGVPELLGIPEGDPAIETSPLSLFGNLTGLGAGPGPVSRTVTVTNRGGTQDLSITGIAINGPDAGLYSFAPPGSTLLAPGEMTEVEVTLTPPVGGGSFEATLEIGSNDLVTPLKSVSLDATVTSDPNIELAFPDPLFGAVSLEQLPASVPRSITVRNTGVANALTLNAPVITGADAASFSADGDLVIPAGEERDLVITLSPNGRDGLFSADLEISSDDDDTPSISISLDANLLPLKLIGFWCFDNAADPFQDLSGSDNHIESAQGPGGGPTWAANTGFEGSGGYEFAGGTRLIVPIDINPTALPQMSWGAWVRPDDINPGLRKVMGHDNGGWDRTIGLDNREGAFRYSSFTGFRRPVVGTPGPVNTTDWAFLGATYDADAQTVTAYVDIDASTTGDPLESVTETGNFNPGFPTFSIGSLRPDNDAEGWNGGIDNAFIYQGFLSAAQMEDLRNGGKAAFTGGATGPRLDVASAGDNLVFTWDSLGGKLYNLRSETDPSTTEPIEWPIFGGNADILATPPENTLTIPRPADSFRLFVIEEFDAPPVAVFSDDFESGQGDWTTGTEGDPGTDWQLGSPSVVGPGAANSPANCFGTNLASNYAIDANIWLRSPEIDLTTAGGATLSYFQFADIEEGFDLGSVAVLDAADDSELAVIESPVDGAGTDWEQVTKSIPAAALGKTIKLEFRFISDDLENFPGWYIDDVVVTVP